MYFLDFRQDGMKNKVDLMLPEEENKDEVALQQQMLGNIFDVIFALPDSDVWQDIKNFCTARRAASPRHVVFSSSSSPENGETWPHLFLRRGASNFYHLFPLYFAKGQFREDVTQAQPRRKEATRVASQHLRMPTIHRS